MKKRMALLAVVPMVVVPIAVLTLWGLSDAATTDSAAATVDPPVALVDAPITFTSTNPCTIACSLTWRRPDIGLARFGGVIVGRGQSFTMSFPDPGSYQVVLDMGETCDGTTRLVCHSYALVMVDVVVDPNATPPADVTPPVDPNATPPVVDPGATPPVVDPGATPPLVVDPVTPPPVVDPVTPPVVDPVTPPVVDPVTPPADPTATPPADSVTPPADVAPPEVTLPSLVAPSDLSITTVAGRNRLTWTNPDSSATVLVVERCKGTGCTSFRPIAILSPSTTSFIESRIIRNTTNITYRIAASDETGTAYSNIQVTIGRRR